MTHAIAVIGAGFGDEGKGLATDYFARRLKDKYVPQPFVARGNGGAQAGHTVCDGPFRHVFGHIGSGALAGVETYLSSKFLVNPLALAKERLKLNAIGYDTRHTVWAHPDAQVSTLFDMALNSLIELKRDKDRHGSCGLGINETVTRVQAGFAITVDMAKTQIVSTEHALRNIRENWIPKRLHELGIMPDTFNDSSAGIKRRAEFFLNILLNTNAATMAFELQTELTNVYTDHRTYFEPDQPMVYEGAQGLRLDEFLGTFPHVTRSVTGLQSAILAAHEVSKRSIQPVYMTRSYTTRHGAGDLTFEGQAYTDKETFFDATNVHNEWQGTIRYAPLDIKKLDDFIWADVARSKSMAEFFGIELKTPVLFVTCMDQLGETVTVIPADEDWTYKTTIKSSQLISTLEHDIGIRVAYTSHGPTAQDVQVHHDVV